MGNPFVSVCPRCNQEINTTGMGCPCGWFPGQPVPVDDRKAVVCPKCDGETVFPGPFMPVSNGTQRTCPTCAGRGYVVI